MTSKQELHVQRLSRFHRIASSVPVAEHSSRSCCWRNADEVFSKLGRGVNGKFAVLFSPLSDEEMTIACEALVQEAIDSADITSWNPAQRLFDRIVLIRAGEVIAMLAPTFLRIASSDTPLWKTFSRVVGVDQDTENTPALKWWLRSFSERRVNWLHGRLMHAIVSRYSNSFNAANSEWFGKNREQIIPMWELLLKDDTFEPERVKVLLENFEYGAKGVLGGAL